MTLTLNALPARLPAAVERLDTGSPFSIDLVIKPRFSDSTPCAFKDEDIMDRQFNHSFYAYILIINWQFPVLH